MPYFVSSVLLPLLHFTYTVYDIPFKISQADRVYAKSEIAVGSSKLVDNRMVRSECSFYEERENDSEELETDDLDGPAFCEAIMDILSEPHFRAKLCQNLKALDANNNQIEL